MLDFQDYLLLGYSTGHANAAVAHLNNYAKTIDKRVIRHFVRRSILLAWDQYKIDRNIDYGSSFAQAEVQDESADFIAFVKIAAGRNFTILRELDQLTKLLPKYRPVQHVYDCEYEPKSTKKKKPPAHTSVLELRKPHEDDINLILSILDNLASRPANMPPFLFLNKLLKLYNYVELDGQSRPLWALNVAISSNPGLLGLTNPLPFPAIFSKSLYNYEIGTNVCNQLLFHKLVGAYNSMSALIDQQIHEHQNFIRKFPALRSTSRLYDAYQSAMSLTFISVKQLSKMQSITEAGARSQLTTLEQQQLVTRIESDGRWKVHAPVKVHHIDLPDWIPLDPRGDISSIYSGII